MINRLPSPSSRWAGPISLAWFNMGSLAIVDVAMRDAAPDIMAVFDVQHGLWDRASTHDAVSIAGPYRSIVRAAANSERDISHAADTGAAAVIVPMVETAAEAARAVDAIRFPPHGHRSAGGVRPLAMGMGEYLADAPTALGVMVETQRGLENVEEIVTTPGVDFIFIGPGDLGLSLAGRDVDLDLACDVIFAACTGAGIPCGIYTMDWVEARRRLAAGAAMVVAAEDVSVLARGFGGLMVKTPA